MEILLACPMIHAISCLAGRMSRWLDRRSKLFCGGSAPSVCTEYVRRNGATTHWTVGALAETSEASFLCIFCQGLMLFLPCHLLQGGIYYRTPSILRGSLRLWKSQSPLSQHNVQSFCDNIRLLSPMTGRETNSGLVSMMTSPTETCDRFFASALLPAFP